MLNLVELLEYEKKQWEKIQRLEEANKSAKTADVFRLRADISKLQDVHEKLEGVLMLVGVRCAETTVAVLALQNSIKREGSEGILWLKLDDVIDGLNEIPDLIVAEGLGGGDEG